MFPPFLIGRIEDLANNADLAMNLSTLFSGVADCTNHDIMIILLTFISDQYAHISVLTSEITSLKRLASEPIPHRPNSEPLPPMQQPPTPLCQQERGADTSKVGIRKDPQMGKAIHHLVNVLENRPGASGKVEKKDWENRR